MTSRVTRRQALQTGAAAMLLPPFVGRAAANDVTNKKRWKMKLSTSTIMFTKLPIEQAIKRISMLKFDAVDIWGSAFGCPHLKDVSSRLGAKGLVACCKNSGVDPYAFSVYREGYAKYAELIGKAGGGVAIHGTAKACKPSELTGKMKELIESMKPEIELAEQYDSYIALENHGGNILNSIDGLKAFTDNNQSKRLGIAMAPFHLQGGKVSVPEAIKLVGEQLLFFYAWQRAKGIEQLPGHGPTDFTPWIIALAEIDYRWCVNPFMHHEPSPDEMSLALEKSRKYLVECYENAISPV